jgi:phosphotransferase system  glucose/maltose/N-acetylglucosamine-specific IIC component
LWFDGWTFCNRFSSFLAIFVGSSSSSQGGEESQKVVVPGAITVTNMEALFKVQQQQQHDKFVPFHIPALSLSFTLFLLGFRLSFFPPV